MVRGRILIGLLLMSAVIAPAQGQTFPPQYAGALQKAQYTVYSGDVNSDGVPDLLLLPKKRLVIIDYDIPIPIFAKPPSPRFVLLSGGGGSFSLDANPSAATVNSSVWQPSNYVLTYGDTLGTGSVALLLQAVTPGKPSFLIATSPTTGAPQLLESLTSATIGLDLGAANTLVTLQDTNYDGRSDLVVWTNGKIFSVFVAAIDGTFTPPQPDAGGGALTAWRAFCAALTLGDASSAQNLIATAAQSQYSPVLAALGASPGVTDIPRNWSAPTALDLKSEYAFLAVTQVENGLPILHVVTLVFEGNRWLVESF